MKLTELQNLPPETKKKFLLIIVIVVGALLFITWFILGNRPKDNTTEPFKNLINNWQTTTDKMKANKPNFNLGN